MQQHPVPQPISSYEFRLIGSMTLKQFTKLAVSCLIALIFYALPLPGFLKWPAIILLVCLGAGMAFLPINERPLDVWIISFFKAVFSPTQYIFKKKLTQAAQTKPPKASQPVTIQQISPQIKTQTQPPPPNKEQEFLKKIQTLFTTLPAPTPKPISKPLFKPKRKAIEAKIAKDISLPFAPTTPGIIYGVIKDKEGKIIEDAILEIQDSAGMAVRALKSNKVGQFRTATPLPKGTYQIITEKEGFEFDIIKLSLKGEIIPPIEINPK